MPYLINPDRNAPWNGLPELPIDKELYYSTEILEQLGRAKAALAKLHGRSTAIPNQGLLINTISLQEARDSSAIENIFTTDDELYKAYSNLSTDRVQGAAKEVLKYREALWKGYRMITENQIFSRDYFLEVFREVQSTKDGIRPSFSQTVIRQGGTGPNAGKVVYTPPRGEAVIEAKLDNLLAFMNDDETYKIDVLLKMAIGHFQFEAIHPFRDGNGRTGRIFNIHYLTHKGLLDYPILYLSRYIIDHKKDYYQFLSQVSQAGNWTDWIIFMLKAVESTSILTLQKIDDIVKTQEAILEMMRKETDFLRPEQLSELIFTQPFTKVKHLTDAGMYAENTASKYLKKLCELKVLEQKTIDGHHYYLNLELHRILAA